ncbi:MAG: choloylglycine hydrolase family protein [Ruminococcaceae bacterium]|nr:choloylglycine hydrolase family protein [Oscillospiraceae bacterium]
MCTAVTYKTKDHYFGRNLDLEYSYEETVTVTPRNYVFRFRRMGEMASHFAMIGMAYVADGYPLYYDATNEKGLSIAGLNFPGNADYKPYCEGKDNVTPFELVPWLLGQCATVSEAKKLLERINLLNEDFSAQLPLSPLHWIISDRECSITLESVKSGIKIYDNPVGVLTNNPTFDYHLLNLSNYMSLSNSDPHNTFAGENSSLKLEIYSRGMGALGLPGDASSMSRFVRAAFCKLNSVSENSETESVSQFFHILKSVEMQRGCVLLEGGHYEITVYSSCCNTDRGIYYYTTYDNSGICAVDMHREDLQGSALRSYPLKKEQMIEYHN